MQHLKRLYVHPDRGWNIHISSKGDLRLDFTNEKRTGIQFCGIAYVPMSAKYNAETDWGAGDGWMDRTTQEYSSTVGCQFMEQVANMCYDMAFGGVGYTRKNLIQFDTYRDKLPHKVRWHFTSEKSMFSKNYF